MKGILIDIDGDIMIRNKSVVIGDNTQDCIERVLMAEKGEFKEYPVLGAGLSRWAKSTNRTKSIKREMAVQLGYLGYEGAKIEVSDDGKLNIEV
jgi:hypothetical protein